MKVFFILGLDKTKGSVWYNDMKKDEPLQNIVNKANAKGRQLMSQMICAGHPVTNDFRAFCAGRSLPLSQGVFMLGHPDPFPMLTPMQCEKCEEIIEDASIVPFLQENPSMDAPALWFEECPRCRARQEFAGYPLFEELDKCSECGEFPCCCE